VTERCAECGQFFSESQMVAGGGARFHFEPDNHFGPEVSEWTCAACALRFPDSSTESGQVLSEAKAHKP
jgi:hypothetical protein